MPEIFIGRVNVHKPNCINVRCDRNTVLGNPFRMTSESQRAAVIAKHKAWLRTQVGLNRNLTAQVYELARLHLKGHDLNLQCWCSPKACHCDSIKELVLELAMTIPYGRSEP